MSENINPNIQSNTEIEQWKPLTIENFTHYQVSYEGQVRSKTGRVMNTERKAYKGCMCSYTIRIRRHSFQLITWSHRHSFQTRTWYTAVHHKYKNKKNNKVENIEWKPIRRGVVYDKNCKLFKGMIYHNRNALLYWLFQNRIICFWGSSE